MKRIITTKEDVTSIGALCDKLAIEIVDANANHTKNAISLFRKTNIRGRNYVVQITFSIPFAGVIQ